MRTKEYDLIFVVVVVVGGGRRVREGGLANTPGQRCNEKQ
jgi:hypothetical protein